jgi:hypothetical protein
MDGPWGMIPGGAFRGTETGRPCVALVATGATALAEIELEVRTPTPRSMTIWNVVLDESMYVPADFLTPFKRWPHHVEADSRVRVRADGQVYRCAAVRVTDPDQIEALRRAIAAKYAIEPDGWASRAEVWWFELGPAPEQGS